VRWTYRQTERGSESKAELIVTNEHTERKKRGINTTSPPKVTGTFPLWEYFWSVSIIVKVSEAFGLILNYILGF